MVDEASNGEAGAKKEAPSSRSRNPVTAGLRKAGSATQAVGRRRYSQDEKSAKLAQIERSVAEGGTHKAAVKDSGISMQTYYQWKRSAGEPVKTQRRPAQRDTAFAELVELEAENQKLRKQLAEKLRAENAELRKRLGMA